ncbi:threonine ammonia-lyase IlvA [Nonomuraea rubra]|uniref:L-threonine dehydratase n=1 Tax=Nonomuraea rubra TaxID=46180 RepID=A0A7X0U0Z9_9ACTN|nr:threonine ammonia-lyase IlvA [Nonomuraea rubra]MBB6551146.1 threonine dehydratase [Nonomuraea rubra]
MSVRLTATMIDQAAERLRPVVRRTPLEPNERLSGLLGGQVLLKREDAQVCRSYKVRGAFNLIASLTQDERRRGVVCASAGNHGQGVAFACARLGISGRVYVPSTTPRQKRERIAALGGDRVEIVVGGGTYDEASGAAHDDSERTGAVYVHPFDDVRTMAGQGTVGLEILEQSGELPGTVVVPVGGGGLISGLAVWLREHSPATRIVGAEPAGAASMRAALDHGGPLALPELDTFVDGAAVGRVGEATFPLVKELVDEVVAVDEGAICTEMLDLYQTDGIIAEPAGALAGAAAREVLPYAPAGPVVCVVSGGNNDVSRYNEVLERSLVHIGLRHYFLVTFPQRPGALRHFLDEVLGEGQDIIAFEYIKKNNRETGPALVGIELERAGDLDDLLFRMKASPLTVERIPPGSPLFTFIL